MASDELGVTEVAGIGAGIVGGGILGGKMGLAAAAFLAPVPIIGLPLALAALLGAPVAGAMLGAGVGRQNPLAGFFSLGLGAVPGVSDGAAMVDVTPTHSTTLPS